MRLFILVLICCLHGLHAEDAPAFQVELIRFESTAALGDAVSKESAQDGKVSLGTLVGLVRDKAIHTKIISSSGLSAANGYKSADLRAVYRTFKEGLDYTLVKSPKDAGHVVAISEIKAEKDGLLAFKLSATFTYVRGPNPQVMIEEPGALITPTSTVVSSTEIETTLLGKRTETLASLLSRSEGELLILVISIK